MTERESLFSCRLVCCMCGRRVSVLYGDYGVCLPCVTPKQRLAAKVAG